MFQKKYLLLGATGAVAAALLVWAFSPKPVAVETAVIASGRYEQAIEEDGRTRLKDRYTVSAPVAARTRRSNASASSSAKALLSDSMGNAWGAGAKASDGAAPTRQVGESGVTASGYCASSACRRWNSRSYSASGTSGASST